MNNVTNAPCTYPVVMVNVGHHGHSNPFPPLILFSASLRALQNLNPVHSEILFSQRFFCRPLLLPPCTVPCKIVLASRADLDTCPNHFTLRFFTVVKISLKGPMACLILSLTAWSVMWSLYEMPSSFLKHLISVACNFFRMSAVNVQVSQVYISTEITRERISLIFGLRYAYRSRWSSVSLVLLLSVQFWTVLQPWNPDL